MNKQAIENAAESLRLAIKDKKTDQDILEGKLIDASLELNYHKGSSEEGQQIQEFIQGKEEEMRILDQEIQGLFDQLYSISSPS